ncbi:MAG TPA: hypothetical protein VJ547_09485, partial [Candidatus Thermoplasmatota archaeon]|nr:hypothetical protein [Candidatus Thermoplasmatota archaeon]
AFPPPSGLSWVIAILPDGRTLPDGRPFLVTQDTDSAAIPTATWISESPRQKVGVQVLARMTLLGVLIAPVAYLVDQEMGLGLSRSQILLVVATTALAATLALRKPLKVGRLGKSQILLSDVFENLERVDELVRKAVAQAGWRIESVEDEVSSRKWRLDIPLKLWYFRSERPTRRYLILETDGLEYQEAHVRLKGQILAALHPVSPEATSAVTSPRSPDRAS